MLIAENITKKFPGVIALDNVCFEFYAGKVNAIIGENGAGKSTLMKVLSGVYQDYEGKILFKGKQVTFSNTRQAQDAGIVIIHQELNLIPWLSIAENIFLGREINTAWGTLNKKAMRQKAQALLDKLKLNVSPETLVSQLKVGQQQIVEIAKALLTESEVIIMDEPTSAISEGEVEVLFGIIEDLRREGKAIVYISHKLNELFKIADRYVVLRDGKSIEAGEMAGMTHDSIIKKMVGREVTIMRKQTIREQSGKLLSAKNISLKHPVRTKDFLLKDISFDLYKGEILGVFGLMGAGRTELLETLFGLNAARSGGSVFIADKQHKISCPADAIKAGIALVPEDRKKDGLVLGLDVQKNLSLTVLKQLENYGIVNRTAELALVNKYIGELKLKTSSEKQLARNLSGGNQQKIVLAKWLATQPRIIMLDEPTRGIDINAKNEIYKLILSLADAGIGVIMVSSEMTEILAVSDRVLVMADGAIACEMPISQATEDNMLKAAIGK
jgi:ribose transport system ATP-binding protein